MTLNQGLIGHWTMDDRDTSGGVLYDRSAYDNHGTLVNSPTTGASGQIGEAYTFDGIDDYVEIADNDTLEPDTEVTVSGWIKTASSKSDSVIYEKETGTPWFRLSLNGDRANFTVSVTSNTYDIRDSSKNYIDGNWHHICGVYDGSEVILYTDGVRRNSSSASGTLSWSGQNAEIGKYNGTSTYVDGEIDDVRLYNRALSESEINQLYQMRTPRVRTDDISKGLVGHWTMDDADTEGSTLRDSSAYGNDSLLTNISTSSTSIVGESYTFNALDSCVESQSQISYTDPFTFLVWIKTNTSNGDWTSSPSRRVIYEDGIIYADQKVSTNGAIRVTNDSATTFNLGDVNDNQFSYAEDTWNLYGIRLGSGQAEMVRDNQIIDTVAVSGDFTNIGTSFIGAENGTTRYWGGDMSSVRLYNRALSDSEINRLYNKRS